MQQRRQIALELNDELGVVVSDFGTAARLSLGPAEVGQSLRSALGVTVDEQLAWRDEWQAWRQWRAAVEEAGVLVFQFAKVPLEQTRGVSLLHFPLPVVGINSKETAPGARIFSLIHELIHVALALGQDEAVASREQRSDAEWQDVERFAEEAASETIIPQSVLDRLLQNFDVRRNSWDVPQLRALAGKFRVTPLAMATRLRAAGLLSWDAYTRWRSEWNNYLSTLKPRKGGISSPVDKTLGRAGYPFAELVIEALDSNRITAVDASRYLDLRFDHFEKLREELRSGAGGVAADDGE